MWTRSFIGVAFILALGCERGPVLVPVSGTVTLDGKPLARASVGFYPLEVKSADLSPASVGGTNEQGEFTLATALKGQPGAVLGKHRVSIVLTPDVGEGDEPAPPRPRGDPRPNLPAKYGGEKSELTFEVPPGGTAKADLTLKSR